jgi:hypothetical protein
MYANAIEVNIDVFKDGLSGESQTLEKNAKAIPTQGDGLSKQSRSAAFVFGRRSRHFGSASLATAASASSMQTMKWLGSSPLKANVRMTALLPER